MKRLPLRAALCLAALATSCRGRSPEPSPAAPPAPATAPAAPAPGPPPLKIWIAKPGVIEMNGRAVELPELGAALDELAKRDGTVIFGQDTPGKEPTPNVVKVLQMIADRRLTFRSAVNRSFTELSPDHHYDKSYLGKD
jgi:hypothetical protein